MSGAGITDRTNHRVGTPDYSVGALGQAAVVLAGIGLAMIGISQQTHRWAAPPVPAAVPVAVKPQAPPSVNTAPMTFSTPVAVRIPAIAVSARIIPLGLGPGGIVNVPPLTKPFVTSWYDRGFAPGQPGPAALFGHVDSAEVGPAVFYRVGDLRPGNLVYVTRADHRAAVFRVDSVRLFPESAFPTRKVYGFTPRPTLRLITCGGQFDPVTHLYLDRTIAFASYIGQTSTHPNRAHTPNPA